MAIINGKKENAAGKTVLEYLKDNNYNPSRVTVEKNGDFIPEAFFESEVIREEDNYKIVLSDKKN